MIIEVKIPGAGESITEAAIGTWLVENGSYVDKDQEIAEVESDKATLPLIAPDSGKIKIMAQPGVKVKIGEIACTIDNVDIRQQAAPEINTGNALKKTEETVTSEKEQSIKVTPLAQTIMNHHELNIEDIITGLKKITRHDVEQVIGNNVSATAMQNGVMDSSYTGIQKGGRRVERTPMSPLRRKLSKRLVAVKNETAMLTTFNEIDMSSLMDLRRKYQAKFLEKHGQKPGLMSFFIKACAKALFQFPKINAYLEDDEIITPSYVDIAIAVQTDKGLMAPVIRDVHLMSIPQIETAIAVMAQKAKSSRLSVEEMTGGTFTITNGGVFGSMLSTPILNPPQSAILGMHNIVDRPVAVNGKVEIRPVMYVALSYDHRLIDGRESVSFLLNVKEMIETPLKLLIEGVNPELQLLDL